VAGHLTQIAPVVLVGPPALSGPKKKRSIFWKGIGRWRYLNLDSTQSCARALKRVLFRDGEPRLKRSEVNLVTKDISDRNLSSARSSQLRTISRACLSFATIAVTDPALT
jgi:hypothetical protein